MSKIEIFDPAMCCPTGVCGPSVDPELTRIATVVFSLEKKGIDIKRHNLGNEPEAFIENTKVNDMLNEKGPSCLPLIVVDGQIEKIGEYPTNEEFSKWTGLSEGELVPSKPKSTLKLNVLE